MIHVNLIPMRRRHQRLQRARRRAWIAVASVYALALALGYGSWRGLWNEDDRDLTRQLTLARGDIDEADKSIAHVRSTFNIVSGELRANETITGQPDWSVLLALIAKLRGDEVVLDHCGLDATNWDAGTPKGAAAVVLRLQGHGRTQAAVSQFVLGLEQTGLFEAVSILKTNREAFGGTDAIAFKLECRLRNGTPESTPQKSAPVPTRRPPGAGVVDAGGNAT
jgi:hypothetical protein